MKNLSDNRVELLKDAPADVRQRLALEFADAINVTYFDGQVFNCQANGKDKDRLWDELTNKYTMEINPKYVASREGSAYLRYKNGVLITESTNSIPRFVYDLAYSNYRIEEGNK